MAEIGKDGLLVEGAGCNEEEVLQVALVVFDAELSCRTRLERQTAVRDRTGLVTIESLGSLSS
jgi:hypothetical protein